MGPPTAISQQRATISPDPYSNPADSDPDYTLNCEEPLNLVLCPRDGGPWRLFNFARDAQGRLVVVEQGQGHNGETTESDGANREPPEMITDARHHVDGRRQEYE